MMHRLNSLSIGLLTLAIASFVPIDVLVQNAVLVQDAVLAQDAPQNPQSQSIEDLLTILEREEPPLGSRGDLCAVSPGLLGETDTVWSDRPTFAWRGEATQITLRSFNNSTPVWQQALSSETQSTPYTGIPLIPGQLYEWELGATTPGPQYVFEVMSQDQRDRIAQDLQTLENQLKAAGESPEAIALAHAHYFAEQRLWSDVFQTLQSVSDPSTALTQGITNMTNYLCGEE